ncbi:MAG: hypothetical protein AB1632_05025 [Nitrospirota bacterium]
MGKIDPAENSEHNLTPDIVIQLNSDYGIIAEVKKKIAPDRKYWHRIFDQIKKYDENLIGWLTNSETIKNYDLTLLTHITRKVDITDYYKGKYNEGDYHYRNKFSIVAFNKGGERDEFLYLEKHYGELSDQNLNERLRRVVAIPLETVLPLYSIKFYDSPPPLPYLMNILWIDIFPQFLSPEEDNSKIKKYSVIKLNISEVTEKLQRQFAQMISDSRQQEIPRQDWIKDAMESLVRLKLARRHTDGANIYEIDFKHVRNPLDYFAKKVKISKRKNISDDERQMKLLKSENHERYSKSP